MKEERQRIGIFQTTAAFALGAVTGSVVALFCAPASGKEIRRRLTLRARNLQRQAIRRLVQTQRVLARQAAQLRNAATEWVTDHVPHGGNGRHAARRVLRHAEAR